jgi:hypothetical protein
LGKLKSIKRHHHDHVGIAAGDILALSAVTLKRCNWLALNDISKRFAVTTTGDSHRMSFLSLKAQRTVDIELVLQIAVQMRLLIADLSPICSVRYKFL